MKVYKMSACMLRNVHFWQKQTLKKQPNIAQKNQLNQCNSLLEWLLVLLPLVKVNRLLPENLRKDCSWSLKILIRLSLNTTGLPRLLS